MQYAILAVLIVLVIAFFVMIWKASPGWRWYTLTALCFTMLLTVLFLFPTAGVLKSRSAWHELKERLEARYEAAEQRKQELNFGNPLDPTIGKGVIPLGEELSKLGNEAGRRWRNLRQQGTQGTAITLVKPAPPDAGLNPADAGDADAAPQTLVPVDLVVYGFAEKPIAGLEVPVPDFYLGEFKVVSSDANTVTIEPVLKLEPTQVERIGSGNGSFWSLYELLPLDGQEPFIAEGSRPDDENVLGRPDEELIKSLLGNRVDADTLNDYLRTGSRANPDDPPASLWTRIEFTQKHTEPVDNPSQSGVLQGGFFDGTGRAVDSRLQRGDKGVDFNVGDQLIVKEEAADALVEKGVAKKLSDYFIRPLNDYRYLLRSLRLRLTEQLARVNELQYERGVLQNSADTSQELLVGYQDKIDKLEKDVDQIRREVAVTKEYNQRLDTRVKQTRETLVRLFKANQQLEDQLQARYGGR